MKQITVIIGKGKARVETTGFVGSACKDATADLERAMGATTSSQTTPEFDVKEVRSISG